MHIYKYIIDIFTNYMTNEDDNALNCIQNSFKLHFLFFKRLTFLWKGYHLY